MFVGDGGRWWVMVGGDGCWWVLVGEDKVVESGWWVVLNSGG